MMEKIHTLNAVNYFAVQSTQQPNTADPNIVHSTRNETLYDNSTNNDVVHSMAVEVTEGWRKLCNRTSGLTLLYKYCVNQMKV
jgi:hypothetical protein